MAYKEFMNKVRYWDNLVSRWMMRHFYFMFFQIVLVAIFVGWFANTIKMIEVGFQVTKNNTMEHIAMNQSVNTTILVLLLLLNSFWLLYIFNTLQRLNNTVRDLNYKVTKFKNKHIKNN